MTRARAIAVPAAIAALALGGCGGGESDDAKSALQDYVDAFAKGDGDRACSLLTKSTRDTFAARVAPITKSKDCATSIDKLSKQAGPELLGALKDAKVSDVKVDGDRATAKLKSGSSTTTTQLRKEDGDWKVAGGPGTQ
ncbi:MAG TPA: DUF4878 domain-containing protein [Thermoleophilaceae bacterium]|jgi:hypothetical protein